MPRKRAGLSLSTAKRHPKSPKSKANQQSHKQTLGPGKVQRICLHRFVPSKLGEALGSAWPKRRSQSQCWCSSSHMFCLNAFILHETPTNNQKDSQKQTRKNLERSWFLGCSQVHPSHAASRGAQNIPGSGKARSAQCIYSCQPSQRSSFERPLASPPGASSHVGDSKFRLPVLGSSKPNCSVLKKIPWPQRKYQKKLWKLYPESMFDFPHFPLDSLKCPGSCNDHQTCENIWEEANWKIKNASMPPYCMCVHLYTKRSTVPNMKHAQPPNFDFHYNPFPIMGSCLFVDAPLELSICIVRIDFDAINIWQLLQALEVFTSAACHQPDDVGLHRDEFCLICRPAPSHPSPCPETGSCHEVDKFNVAHEFTIIQHVALGNG